MGYESLHEQYYVCVYSATSDKVPSEMGTTSLQGALVSLYPILITEQNNPT